MWPRDEVLLCFSRYSAEGLSRDVLQRCTLLSVKFLILVYIAAAGWDAGGSRFHGNSHCEATDASLKML